MAPLTFYRAVCFLCWATLPQNRSPTSPQLSFKRSTARFGNSLR